MKSNELLLILILTLGVFLGYLVGVYSCLHGSNHPQISRKEAGAICEQMLNNIGG